MLFCVLIIGLNGTDWAILRVLDHKLLFYFRFCADKTFLSVIVVYYYYLLFFLTIV